MGWHALDADALSLVTGRPPEPPGAPSAAAALAAAPVVRWPVRLRAGNGQELRVGRALGPGGERVESLLDRLAGSAPPPPAAAAGDLAALATATPAGPVDLPLAVVPLHAGVRAAAGIEPRWLAEVDDRRSDARRALLAGGREAELEAALHVAVLVATERLDPADDADVDAHVASGAQLWLLTAAVASALAGARPDPFGPWAELVVAGLWPLGPSGGRLVVCDPGRPA